MQKKLLICLKLLAWAIALNSVSVNAQPYSLSPLFSTLGAGQALFETGAYWSHQGQTQHIDIETLIGDEFTVSNHGNSNSFFGFGYLFEGPQYGCAQLNYGVHAFYLPKTSVAGYVIQENLFTNLSYGYHVTHFPVYAALEIKSNLSQLPVSYFSSLPGTLAMDIGIGPNFRKAGGFREYSLDGITIPDNAFGTHSNTTFTFTTGVNWLMPNVFCQMSLEVGYRFFYLGNGHLSRRNDQILNNLKTGDGYANAIVVGVRI